MALSAASSYDDQFYDRITHVSFHKTAYMPGLHRKVFKKLYENAIEMEFSPRSNEKFTISVGDLVREDRDWAAVENAIFDLVGTIVFLHREDGSKLSMGLVADLCYDSSLEALDYNMNPLIRHVFRKQILTGWPGINASEIDPKLFTIKKPGAKA